MDDSFFDLNDEPEGVGGGVLESSMGGSASKVGATRTKQTNFSAYEDNVLCKSWLEISCDPVINTGQRRESFWIRVVNRYNSNCGRYPKRTQKSITNRWDHIKAEVSKFSGYMAEMIRSNPSGMSDADKSVAAAADFASVEKHNFTLMHCWKILKDEPKWMELKRKMDMLQNSGSRKDAPPNGHHILDLDAGNSAPSTSAPSSSSGKRPMGRDAAKAAKKKAASSEYVSKIHDLSVQKIELFKETEGERKARLDEIVTLEKVKVEEAREHRKMKLDIEREKLALERRRLDMEAEKKKEEAEKKEKEEDERILAINLDQCQPLQRMYYQALQEDIIQKLVASRCHGPGL
ncbi:unnamed protein product [Urochloa decumbens]|uniref:No apical meristem-associated C-terminal domain-containing protein n=1 Tax=Urochloa decumbens TaxID=240449 RepID=A0ABC9CB76_9POAL